MAVSGIGGGDRDECGAACGSRLRPRFGVHPRELGMHQIKDLCKY